MFVNSQGCLEQCPHSPEPSVGSVHHEMNFLVRGEVLCDLCISAGLSSRVLLQVQPSEHQNLALSTLAEDVGLHHCVSSRNCISAAKRRT
jgi:hypothetical protein